MLASAAIAVLFLGCSHVYYPGASPIPLMTAQGEIQAAGYIMSDGMGMRAAAQQHAGLRGCGETIHGVRDPAIP